MKEEYICPLCKAVLVSQSDGIKCKNDHFFPYISNTTSPVFDSAEENINEYNVSQAAEMHDNALKWLFATFGGSEHQLRKNLISRLNLQTGQKILVTGVGAGNDLPYLAELLGENGTIFAQDFSSPMLESAIERTKSVLGLDDYDIHFSVSDATNLPFKDNLFDATYHFGGLNIFPDIRKGISEMDRVTKDGGRVVFGDEGLPAWLKNTDYGKMVINNNPLCIFDAPMSDIPETARKVNLSWDVGYCFYIIDYTVSNQPLDLNIDIPHIGVRGGTIRSRYYGQLEGVNPQLKNELYELAKRMGLSRVDLLEKIIKDGLKDNGV
ncbi:methyltransferase domain-containing protein [Enterovibrio makurazakiensis]|uniref:class I SAM-dependent methyltransferase n=1 Tax=Enterovibrio makurazakiensis TaxID=2910232 RepID=UPI003D259394